MLGLATGSSPLGVYDELVRRHEEGGPSFARAKGFMLDEYVGLPADHPERYRNVIETEIAGRVDFAPGAVTQGLATIMRAAHIVLLATGRAKADAVHQLVEGPVSAMWPGTILQHHPHVTVLVDKAAASRLQLADYFRGTYAAKPSWQGL